ncbi:SAM-dependent methyltransferase [Leptolyngbya sp. 7M]|uniref:SAM-dependent methyltransferase n=1 Tax=Leptolyngbya sp. 7M TaxID=2812896 RepID=UPI0021F1613D|nr:methyltransferase domain-containing protein [Leptolyngbya sp. 7M]
MRKNRIQIHSKSKRRNTNVTFSSTKQVSSRSIQRILLAGIGALSFTGIACTQQRSLEQPQTVSPQASTTEQTQTSPDATIQPPSRRPDVVYVPTPMPVVDEMLNLANVQSDDVVYDLGSGDGRIVIAAAQERGARGISVEIDPQRIQEANQNAQRAGVTDRVEFLQQGTRSGRRGEWQNCLLLGSS